MANDWRSDASALPAGVYLIELRAGHAAQRLHRLAEGFSRFVRQPWQRFKRKRAGDFEPDEPVDFRLLFDAGVFRLRGYRNRHA